MNSTNKSSNRIILGLILLIAVIYFFIQQCFTLVGDDLIFKLRWEELDAERGWLAYPTFFYRHWFWSNARLADKINPLFFGIMPEWIMWVCNSIIMILLIMLTLKLSGLKANNLFGKTFLLALIVFALPWWDYMLLNVCWLNYVWAAALGLFTIYLFLKCTQWNIGKLTIAVMCLATVFSVAMHEAEGVAVFCGLTAYVVFVRKWRCLSKLQKILFLCVLAGAVYVVSSPASYSRLGGVEEMSNRKSMLEILLTSNFFVLFLILLSAYLCCFRRKAFLALLKSEWLIYFVAAIVSLGFSLISGIIGRTGFFAQIFALIAIFGCFQTLRIQIKETVKNSLSVVLILLMITHFIGFYYYSRIAGSELKNAISEFKKSSDGLVYMDYLRGNKLPWWLQCKVRGVPDVDDVWVLHTISLYYADSEKPMIVLPCELKDYNVTDIRTPMKFGKDVISPYKPKTMELITYEKIPLEHFFGTLHVADNGCLKIDYCSEGIEYIVTPFEKDGKELYLISERYINPGD